MRHSRFWQLAFAVTIASVAILGLCSGHRLRVRAADEGFVPLGKSLDDFVLVNTPPETWSFEGDVIKCAGRPNGYLATKKSYRNFVLRFEFKFVRPKGLKNDWDFRGNSGYLIYITGEHRVWPKCVEVQGMYRQVGRIFAIGGAPRVNARDYPDVRRRVLKPVGEWNSLEVISRDGALTARLNGEVVCESEPGQLKEGPIGFQSEGAEIHWRNVRIKVLD